MNFLQFKEKNRHLSLSENELYTRYKFYLEDLEFQEWTRRKVLERTSARGQHMTSSPSAAPAVSGGAGAGSGGIVVTGKSAKTTISLNGADGTSVGVEAKTTSGYLKIEWWDGTSSIIGNGSINSWFDTSYNTSLLSGEYSFKVFSCDVNGLPSGDILGFEGYSGNYISIDVSQLKKLQELYFGGNMITSVNLSGLSELHEIDFSNNVLTSINIKGCTSLTYLNLYSNFLTSFDTDGITGVLGKCSISIQSNSFDGSGLDAFYTSLGEASTYKNYIDVSNNPGTTSDNKGIALAKGWYVNGTTNDRVELKTSKNTGTISGIAQTSTGYLKVEWWNNTTEILGDGTAYQDITWSKVSDQTLNKFIRLYPSDDVGTVVGDFTLLDCNSLDLTVLDVEGVNNLAALDCSNNPNLKALNVANRSFGDNLILDGCIGLEYLNVSNCSLNSLSIVVELPYLKTLIAYGNQNQTGLDLISHNNLEYVDVTLCNLSELHIEASASKIKRLYANANSLSTLDLTGAVSLADLNCSNNPITDLNLTDCHSLLQLSISNINVVDLDASYCTKLTGAYIYGLPYVETINFSGCTALQNFNLENLPELLSVTADRCTALTQIYIQYTNLPNLDLTDCTLLSWVYIGNNRFIAPSLNSTFESLVDRSLLNGDGWIGVNGNIGSGTCDTSILIPKHWNFQT